MNKPLFLTLLLILSSAFIGTATRAANPARLLDVKAQRVHPGEFRVIIVLDRLVEAQIKEPDPKGMMAVEVQPVSVDGAFKPTFRENALVRGLRVRKKGGDHLRLEFLLASPEVDVQKLELPSEGIFMAILKPRPGVTLQEEAPRQNVDQEPLQANVVYDQAQPTTAGEKREAGHSALPQLPRAVSQADRPMQVVDKKPLKEQANVDSTPSGGTDGPRYLPTDTAMEVQFSRLEMDFPESEELMQAFKEYDYLEAYKIGTLVLARPLPAETLEKLLYLLAECRFQLEQNRDLPSSDVDPDWEAAQNFYRQAIRNAPDSVYRPMADYRLSQIFERRQFYEKQQAQLMQILKDYPNIINLPNVLSELGQVSLSLYNRGMGRSAYLIAAQQAFLKYLELFPDGPVADRMQTYLAETWYQQGDYAKCVELIQNLIQKQAETGQPFDISIAILEHYFLAAQKSGAMNLVDPQTADEKTGVLRLTASSDPDIRMEFGHILEEGGNYREAMRHYFAVAELLPRASEDQQFEANRAITRIALEDKKKGIKRQVAYPQYNETVDTLAAMYRGNYNVDQRLDILKAIVETLVSEGREVTAVRLLLPYLEEERLPESMAQELSTIIWDLMPKAIAYFEEQGDGLFALQVYEGLGKYLQQHPAKDDILLECAQVLLDSELWQQAGKVLEGISPYAQLSPPQQRKLTVIKRELRLDPSKPQRIKAEAPLLLDPEYRDELRARVVRKLAPVYVGEGRFREAAQLYLKAANFSDLPWQERLRFYREAAETWRSVPNYSKIIEVSWQAIRDFESTGVSMEEGGELVGDFLLLLGENFRKTEDYEKSIRAYREYLKYYPQSEEAPMARYYLAQSHLDLKQRQEGLENLKILAADSQGGFWAQVAQKLVVQMEWENAHPYMLD